MKTIFFIKNASAGLNDPNSIVLRYRIFSTKKQKVKGLGISCTKTQWNQEEQKVKRANSSYKLFNKRLTFIQDEILLLEEKKGKENITPEEIDNIVEASLSGIEVDQVINQKDLLTSVIDKKIVVMELDESIGSGNIENYITTKKAIERLEKEKKTKYTMTYLDSSLNIFLRDFINYRRKTVAESTLYANLKKINSVINWYNLEYNKRLRTIKFNKIKFIKLEKEKVFFTKSEIKTFYDFVFAPENFDIDFTNEDIKYIKRFLFRCFCGMRIQDMNTSNIHENSVLPLENKKFTYYQQKGKKECSVPFIGELYLYNLASSLNFDFPEFLTESEVKAYARKETAVMRLFYGLLIKPQRKRKITTNNRNKYELYSKCISSHTARKTFAKTIIYDSFKDIYFTSKMLGHKDIKTTEMYLGINEEEEFTKYQDLKLNI